MPCHQVELVSASSGLLHTQIYTTKLLSEERKLGAVLGDRKHGF